MNIRSWVIPPLVGGLAGMVGWAGGNALPYVFQAFYFQYKFYNNNLGKGEYTGCVSTIVLNMDWKNSGDIACINDDPNTEKDANCEWKYVCKPQYFYCDIPSKFEKLCTQPNITRAFYDAYWDYMKANIYVFPFEAAVILGVATGFCFSIAFSKEEEDSLDPQSEQKPTASQRCSKFFTTPQKEENTYSNFHHKRSGSKWCLRFFITVPHDASTRKKEEKYTEMNNIVGGETNPLLRRNIGYGSSS